MTLTTVSSSQKTEKNQLLLPSLNFNVYLILMLFIYSKIANLNWRRGVTAGGRCLLPGLKYNLHQMTASWWFLTGRLTHPKHFPNSAWTNLNLSSPKPAWWCRSEHASRSPLGLLWSTSQQWVLILCDIQARSHDGSILWRPFLPHLVLMPSMRLFVITWKLTQMQFWMKGTYSKRKIRCERTIWYVHWCNGNPN
jgi:hypothetical protein